MIPKVKKLAFDHIHKAAKIQFHKEVLDILDKNGLDRILPENLIGEYRQNVAHLPELDRQYVADPLTKRLERLDDARDAAFRVIRFSLSAMSDSLDNETVRYYETAVEPMLAAFWDFTPEADYATETEVLRAFCGKVRELDFSMLAKAYVTRQQIDDLAALNDRFEAVYVERTEKRSKYESPAALVRALEDEWRILSAFVTARANDPVTDESRPTVEAFRTALNALNEHIDYYRQNYIVRGKK